MLKYIIITTIPNKRETSTYFLPIKVDWEKFNVQDRARYSNDFHKLRSALMLSFIEKYYELSKKATSRSELPLRHSFDLINKYVERLTSENTSDILSKTGLKHITDSNLERLKAEGLATKTGHLARKGIIKILIFLRKIIH